MPEQTGNAWNIENRWLQMLWEPVPLISAKRLRSDERTHTSHQDAEGRLLLNLRIHFGLLCVLKISAIDARIFPEVGILAVAIWYGVTCYYDVSGKLSEKSSVCEGATPVRGYSCGS